MSATEIVSVIKAINDHVTAKYFAEIIEYLQVKKKANLLLERHFFNSIDKRVQQLITNMTAAYNPSESKALFLQKIQEECSSYNRWKKNKYDQHLSQIRQLETGLEGFVAKQFQQKLSDQQQLFDDALLKPLNQNVQMSNKLKAPEISSDNTFNGNSSTNSTIFSSSSTNQNENRLLLQTSSDEEKANQNKLTQNQNQNRQSNPISFFPMQNNGNGNGNGNTKNIKFPPFLTNAFQGNTQNSFSPTNVRQTRPSDINMQNMNNGANDLKKQASVPLSFSNKNAQNTLKGNSNNSFEGVKKNITKIVHAPPPKPPPPSMDSSSDDNEESTSYKCHLCGDMFTTRLSWESHLVTHQFSNRIKKKVVKTMSKTKSKRKKKRNFRQLNAQGSDGKNGINIINKSSNKRSCHRYQCEFCDKKYTRQMSYVKHYNNHMLSNDNNECNFCLDTFQSEQELKQHIYEFNAGLIIEDGFYQCCQCTMRFEKKNELKSHICSEHKMYSANGHHGNDTKIV